MTKPQVNPKKNKKTNIGIRELLGLYTHSNKYLAKLNDTIQKVKSTTKQREKRKRLKSKKLQKKEKDKQRYARLKELKLKINSSKTGQFEELFEGHFQSQNIEDGFKLFTRKINNISKPQKLLHINGIEKHEFSKMPLEEQKKHLESELKTRDTNLFKYIMKQNNLRQSYSILFNTIKDHIEFAEYREKYTIYTIIELLLNKQIFVSESIIKESEIDQIRLDRNQYYDLYTLSMNLVPIYETPKYIDDNRYLL